LYVSFAAHEHSQLTNIRSSHWINTVLQSIIFHYKKRCRINYSSIGLLFTFRTGRERWYDTVKFSHQKPSFLFLRVFLSLQCIRFSLKNKMWHTLYVVCLSKYQLWERISSSLLWRTEPKIFTHYISWLSPLGAFQKKIFWKYRQPLAIFTMNTTKGIQQSGILFYLTPFSTPVLPLPGVWLVRQSWTLGDRSLSKRSYYAHLDACKRNLIFI